MNKINKTIGCVNHDCAKCKAVQETQEAACKAAAAEGNKLGVKSTDALRIVAAYLNANPPAAQPAVPEGWKLVPVEPTREMWIAVNKLDDQMAAGSYDGKGCSIEQAWNCLLDAAPEKGQE